MILSVLGVLLLIIPFLVLTLFKDLPDRQAGKNKGFIYIVFFILVSQSLLGLLTQALGFFYYPVILSGTILIDAVILFFWFRKLKRGNKLFVGLGPRVQQDNGGYQHSRLPAAGREKSLLPSEKNRIDWLFFVVLAFSLLNLWQVHYNYTGKINLATDQTIGYHEVKNMNYVYPYFSDEWYAVSLVQGAINYHSLPIHNLLTGKLFQNLELFFHSLVAQLMLLLSLDPLLQYTLLTIFINSLFVVLVYVFLKLCGISKLSSAIASMLLLYITSGANMPYIWHLIPFNSGLIFSVLAMCFMVMDKFRIAVLANIIAILFYPPLFLFSVVAFLAYTIPKIKGLSKENFRKIFFVFLPIVFSVLFAVIIFCFIFFNKTSMYLVSRVWFETFVGQMLPRYALDGVVLWPILILAILGVYGVFKKNKIIFYQFLLGCSMWFAYSLSTQRFFIEFERIAVFTAVLGVIISAYGVEIIINYFKKKKIIYLKYLYLLIFIIFFACIPFYTQNENWRKLLFLHPVSGKMAHPKAPANNYLTQNDLEIFKNIKNRKFLSLPWKGTVIGVATGNFPAVTKEGTISVGNASILTNFIYNDCQGKQKLAKSNKLDYIYLYSFECPDFKKITESQEGLILYKVSQ